MTRHNDHFKEKQFKNKISCLLLPALWRENSDVSLLGVFVHGGDENDSIQEQCKHSSGKRLVYGT